MRLATPVLPQLAEANVVVPAYDRSILQPGILHVGVGNFHKSHLANYIDDILNDDPENNKDWGIVGAGQFSYASKLAQLEPQDWMQMLVARDGTSASAQVLGSMIDFIPAEPEAFQKTLDGDAIKIVSLTVTEGGYFLNDGEFDVKHPDIQHDIQNPDKPKTIFGLLVKGLKERMENNEKPFTVMSCDNVPHNGDVTKGVIVGLAKEIDPKLAAWIEENGAFPNGMVDRITPATTDEQRDFVKENYGVEDVAPVFCEPFRQWVLEDNFCAGRPAFEKLETVDFVEDVSPYELTKLRILNGGHASLCYPSALLNLDYVHESMEHETIGPFLDTLEGCEILTAVPTVMDPKEYWETTKMRFSNPTLKDTIDRNCYDGGSRQPKFIIPIALDNLENGRSIDGLALVSAMWCTYCLRDEPNDPQWDRLHANAIKAKDDPKCWLDMTDVYGAVGTNPIFIESFTKALKSIEANGVEAAMKEYIASKK